MDITFQTPEGRFNYRVCAIITQDGQILAMKDENAPYYYLPGGRVKLGEEAEAALGRELREELGIEGRILRPLWLNQGFFTEDVTAERFHELCLYFLVDVSHTGLAGQGTFTKEEHGKALTFSWLPFNRLKEEYFYPCFLKEEIFRLPEHLTLRAEWE